MPIITFVMKKKKQYIQNLLHTLVYFVTLVRHQIWLGKGGCNASSISITLLRSNEEFPSFSSSPQSFLRNSLFVVVTRTCR